MMRFLVFVGVDDAEEAGCTLELCIVAVRSNLPSGSRSCCKKVDNSEPCSTSYSTLRLPFLLTTMLVGIGFAQALRNAQLVRVHARDAQSGWSHRDSVTPSAGNSEKRSLIVMRTGSTLSSESTKSCGPYIDAYLDVEFKIEKGHVCNDGSHEEIVENDSKRGFSIRVDSRDVS